jgi:hypothetical protein
MTNLESTLQAIAQTSDRPLDEVVTHHLLEGILRRVACSHYAADLVLRGGMLTRLWVPLGQRIAADVDFLGLYPFAIASTEERFRALLSAKGCMDGIVFDLDSLAVQGIWLETAFPGVRICLPASVGQYSRSIQIDIGFGDPLVPPAEWIEYPTLVAAAPVKLQAVRPETMAAWKLHGLIEQGAKRWRAKDLYDLMLLATGVPLERSLLPEAIQVAFGSYNADLQEVREILTDCQWWDTGKNRHNWRWYCRKVANQSMPEDLLTVVAPVIAYWKPVMESLSDSDLFTRQ